MGAHIVYLALIAVMTIVIVFVVAKLVRTKRSLREAENVYGIKDIPRVVEPRMLPLRETPDDPEKEPSLEYFKRQMDSIVESVKEEPTLSSDEIQSAMRDGMRLESSLVLEMSRVANLRRIQESEDSSPIEEESTVDAAEAALAIEYMGTLMRLDKVHSAPLFAAAVQSVCRQVDWIKQNCPSMMGIERLCVQISGEFSRACNIKQLVENRAPEAPDAVMGLLRDSAIVFELAALVGWTVAGGDLAECESIRGLGRYIGIAEKISEDMEEHSKNSPVAGVSDPSWNIINVIGKDAARQEMERNLSACELILQRCRLGSSVWHDLFRKVRGRTPNQPLNVQVEEPAGPSEDRVVASS